jgi:hypothetical protein
LVIKQKEFDNLKNENKMFGIEIFSKIFKQNYQKSSKIEKITKRGKLISSEFDNMVYSDIINMMSSGVELKYIHCFDFESVLTIFQNNSGYLDQQIKNSDSYHKIIKYVI